MKSRIIQWPLDLLYKRRNQINFPVYQRGDVWFEEKKILLIESIFMGMDIPKLYLFKTEDGWDCIDGQQRIKSIIGFFDGEFAYNNCTFHKLTHSKKDQFENYELTVVEYTDIKDEEVRQLFVRLQLGAPANSGEKLNAINSNMGEFVKLIVKEPFMHNVGIPIRRFAKQQVCAQICNNSMFINKPGDFKNSKYEDLAALYRAYKDFNTNSKEAKGIIEVLKHLNDIFGVDASDIRNRASVVSIYLFVEEIYIQGKLSDKESLIRKFYLEFMKSLKKESRLGVEFNNKFLVRYQSNIIQGADSKNSIEFRHEKLKEAFDYYIKHKKIIGY